jgi:hypothetical protein
MEEDHVLFTIGADLVLQECQCLAHLKEESSDVALWHWLVVLGGIELARLPLVQVAKRMMLIESSATLRAWVIEGLVNWRHYPTTIWYYGNSPDLERKQVDVGVVFYLKHLLDDLVLGVGDLLQEHDIARDGDLFLPFTRPPDKGLSAGGGFKGLAPAPSASSGSGSFV